MDDERLKNMGGGGYWYELLNRIRDIRSSEKVMYRQVLDLYATSVDYDPKSLLSIEFFKIVQNKLHYAAHGRTVAEVIFDRADSDKPLYMEDYIHQLDNILASTGENVLQSAGSISHEQAVEKALSEYRKYQVKTLSPVEQAYLETIKSTEKKIGKTKAK